MRISDWSSDVCSSDLGRRLALGNRRLLDELGLDPGSLAESAQAWETEGRTLSWLIEQGTTPRVLGLFAFGDTLKPGALAAVQALNERHIGSHLLTGDNRGRDRKSTRLNSSH